jgi:hypothetical protein
LKVEEYVMTERKQQVLALFAAVILAAVLLASVGVAEALLITAVVGSVCVLIRRLAY